MQTPTDPLDAAALADALASPVRRFTHLLEVDWDRDGSYSHPASDLSEAVESASVSRALADNTPGADVVLSGSAAAQLTVTLTGHLILDGVQWAVSELLAPYNSESPLFGAPVINTPIRWSITTETSRGPITLRQFTGWLDEHRVDRKHNTVRWVGLDAAKQLENPAWWAPWAVDSESARLAGTTAGMRGLASAVVDQLCQQAGLRTSPVPRWEQTGTAVQAYRVLDIPLHGSFAPAVGWVGHWPPQIREDVRLAPLGDRIVAPQQIDQPWIPGPFGLARNARPGAQPGRLIYRGAVNGRVTGWETAMIFWAWLGPGVQPGGVEAGEYATLIDYDLYIGSDSDQYCSIRISTNGDRIRYTRAIDGTFWFTTFPVITTLGWHSIELRDNHSTSYTLWVDGVSQGTESVAASFPTRSTYVGSLLSLSCAVPMSDLRIWQENGGNAPRQARTVIPGAVIDASLNEITHHPPLGENDTAWSAIRAVAAAESAAVLIDENGVFRYRNRDSLANGDDAGPITLAAAGDIGATATAIGAANSAQVTAQAGVSAYRTVLNSDDPFLILAPPGVSRADLRAPDLISCEEWLFRARYTPDVGSSTPPRSPGGAWTAWPWTESVVHGYVPSYVSGGLIPATLSPTSLYPLLGVGREGTWPTPGIRVDVTNRLDDSIIFALPRDQATNNTDLRAAFRLGGCGLTLRPVETTTLIAGANVTADGATRTIDIGGGPWHQHLPSVLATAQRILRRATQPIPTFDTITTPGDPRRQLTDRTTLLLGGSGQRVKAYLVGITRTLSRSGLTDQVAARATHAPGRWALGDTVLGRLESTAVLG